jgi:hexosaminidase
MNTKLTRHLHSFSAEITATGTIKCRLETASGTALTRPEFCFSLMVPGRVLLGGELIESDGGFCVVRLNGVLTAATPLEFEIAHEDSSFVAGNRAWLPLGTYLRHADGSCEPVAPLPAGILEPHPLPLVTDSGMLRLVPAPAAWQAHGGTHALDALQVSGDLCCNLEFEAVDQLAQRMGFAPLISKTGHMLRVTRDAGVTPEGYVLEITADQIQVRASDNKGVFHAAITLLNLRQSYNGAVPRGRIEDAPRFSWRGQHLDCARHYFQPSTILRLLDLMALLKLNVFHWHFADDEAFRLEVDCYPDLWQKSAYRGEGQVIPGVFGGGAGPTGGSYSKPVAADIVAHAAALHIDVLPEIEVPAHALATTRILPNLRDENDTGREMSVQGYLGNAINPAKPETWDFLTALSSEVAALFPFAHLHVGCDELPAGTWQGSPLINTRTPATGQTATADVQGETVARLATHLRAQNIRPCAWEEAALGSNGGIGNDAILFSWSSQGPGIEAAKRGYDVVMCPAQNVYFDMAYTRGVSDWGANWAGITSLADTINWDPVPADCPEIADRILGVEGAFWSEFTCEDREMEALLVPRILGLSFKAWSPLHTSHETALFEVTQHYLQLFDQAGWTTGVA